MCNIPDVARLPNEQRDKIEHEITSQPRLSVFHELAIAIARAAEDHAWHSRDVEVAELQEQLDVTLVELGEAEGIRVIVAKSGLQMRVERDAALGRARVLVEAIELARSCDWEDFTIERLVAIATSKQAKNV